MFMVLVDHYSKVENCVSIGGLVKWGAQKSFRFVVLIEEPTMVLGYVRNTWFLKHPIGYLLRIVALTNLKVFSLQSILHNRSFYIQSAWCINWVFHLQQKKNALLERKGRKHGSTISNSAARTTVTANSPCANAGRLVKCPGCSGWTKLVHTLENHAIDHILWN